MRLRFVPKLTTHKNWREWLPAPQACLVPAAAAASWATQGTAGAALSCLHAHLQSPHHDTSLAHDC